MRSHFARFVKDASGVTAIEYALIAGIISIVIVGALTVVGGSLNTKFSMVANDLK
jgi:pilus assembly protein Flp/PilA